MFEKNTVIQTIEIDGNGIIRILVVSRLFENGVEIQKSLHRTAFIPGMDIDAHFVAVNEDLVRLNRVAVSGADIARLKTHAATAWTPEVIAAFPA